jgi:cullin 1
MKVYLATKKTNFNDKWDEFEKDGIDRLTKFLSEDIERSNKIQNVRAEQVFNNKEFMRLYKIIYDLCIVPKGNFSKILYQKYVEVTSRYLIDHVLPDLVDASGAILLKRLANHWDKHMNIFVKWLGKCFRYLDQHYVKQQSLETVANRGESLFRIHVFIPVKINVFKAIIQEFEKEREGEWIDGFSLISVLQMIIKFKDWFSDEVDFYTELKEFYKKETATYYNIKGKEFLRDYNCQEYLHKVDLILEQERVLKENEFGEFALIVQDELLVKNMENLFNKPTGLSYILKNHSVDDIKLLYKLYSPLQDWLREIAHQFKLFISLKGNEIVDALEETVKDVDRNAVINLILDSNFIGEMMGFWEKYVKLLKKDLSKNTYFVTSFESAFSLFLNRYVQDHTIAEILARSSEKVLKKGNQFMSDLQIYHYIDNITNLFIWMEDKDLFIEVYRWGLAKRLLDNKIASIDYEKELIGKIKMNCGPQYTSKVEGMLNDMSSEAHLIKEFFESEQSKTLPVEFEVKVLTDGHWPSFKAPPIVLPPNINNWVETFNKFYQDKNKMKHLSWSFMHGSCSVHANLPSGQYDMILTTYQTWIIMLFNENDELSMNDMKNILKTEEELLRNMLDSLACKKYKILFKTQDPKVISLQDVFSINPRFSKKLKRFTIPAPVIRESFNKERVDIDRSLAIEAAIVKIMKSRKKMTYMHLVNEVMTILQMFKPTPTVIKNRIESLIEKDFLERDSEDGQVFRYLA